MPTQIDFVWRPYFGDHISAPRRCGVPKFLRELENNQIWLPHTLSETGVFLTISFKKGWKIGLILVNARF